MFKALKKLCAGRAPQPAQSDARHIHVAVACLLHESKRVDSGEEDVEHKAAQHALGQLFALEEREIEPLLAQGREKAGQLTSYFAPIAVINRAFSLDRRIALVEHLWRIAYANGRLDRDEDHFVRKIAHLLHVPNTQCMVARSQARAQH